MKTIKNKVVRLVLSISFASILLLGTVSGINIFKIRQNTAESLQGLSHQAAQDATDALHSQKKEELLALAENKSSLADTSLNLILNQTRLVAMAAQDIYSDPGKYIQGRTDGELPLDAYDFSCNYQKEVLGSFSFHLRGPRSVMKSDSIVEKNGRYCQRAHQWRYQSASALSAGSPVPPTVYPQKPSPLLYFQSLHPSSILSFLLHPFSEFQT